MIRNNKRINLIGNAIKFTDIGYLNGVGNSSLITEYEFIDEELLKEIPDNIIVLKQPIWEPYNWYKKLIGQKKEDKINSGFLSEKEKQHTLIWSFLGRAIRWKCFDGPYMVVSGSKIPEEINLRLETLEN